jgi:CBS domain-containing protein
VAKRKDPEKTRVRSVMTKSVKTVRADCRPAEAISVMVENRIRHIVLVNGKRRVVGIASARDIFQNHLESLHDQVLSLEAFVEQDGHGG